MSHKSVWVLQSLVVALALNAGCSQSGPASAIAAANDSNIKRLSNLYQSFASRNGWHGPKDEAEFKEFIRTFPAHRLQMLGVDPDQLDALFKSERDDQPFQIKYQVSSGLGAVIPVVFEQHGEDDKKMVGFTDGSIQVPDEHQYRQWLDDAKPDGTPAK